MHKRKKHLMKQGLNNCGEHLMDILPAIGTHFPMTDGEIEKMFPGIPRSLFRVHDWRNDVVHVGTVPADYVGEVSGGVAHYPIPKSEAIRTTASGWGFGFDSSTMPGRLIEVKE